MESVASTNGQNQSQLRPLTQPTVDRLLRALDHPLRLLDRSTESDFSVLGATGNVYTVSLTTTPSCTCPDRTSPCKHILFILIRVLGVPLDDLSIRRKTLKPCHVRRLLNLPVSSETLAGETLRKRFRELAKHRRSSAAAADDSRNGIEKGTVCPVCLEEMGSEEKVLACATCRNLVHEECLMEWKRSGRRRGTTCVVCRARWRTPRSDHESSSSYINLSAYSALDQDDHQLIIESNSNVMCVD